MLGALTAAFGIGKALYGAIKGKGSHGQAIGGIAKGLGSIAGGVQGARQQGTENRFRESELDLLRKRFGLDQQQFGHQSGMDQRGMAINEGRYADERANAARLAENDGETAQARAKLVASLMQRFGVQQ